LQNWLEEDTFQLLGLRLGTNNIASNTGTPKFGTNALMMRYHGKLIVIARAYSIYTKRKHSIINLLVLSAICSVLTKHVKPPTILLTTCSVSQYLRRCQTTQFIRFIANYPQVFFVLIGRPVALDNGESSRLNTEIQLRPARFMKDNGDYVLMA
jgi:hypothetical protein